MSQSGAVTVPLLILVSLGICNVIREYDIRRLTDTEPWISKVPLLDITIPNIGPFIVIHGLNHTLVLLTIGFATADYQSGNPVSILLSSEFTTPFILVMITCLYLLIYPLLEVREYQNIPASEEGGLPVSMQHHLVFAALTLALSFAHDYTYRRYGAPASQDWIADFPIPEVQMLLGVVIFIVVLVNIFGYVILLSREIDNYAID